MRRLFVSALMAALMLVPATPALADHSPTPGASPPAQACTGLDRAHHIIHGSGTVGEHVNHDLRAAAGC